MPSKEKILVTVSYVGATPWTEEVPGETPLLAIKVRAMTHFQLEVGQQDKYVLQFSGADQADTQKVENYGTPQVTLTLTLKEEPNKG